jgi:hypothetical protein
MEPFDQTLGEVLRDRPLTPDETREVTESLLSALEAVEAAGLHHGHIDASGVLGVGDNIKLRSDCLTPRPGESDASAFAALIYNALTGRRFSSERDALQLPAPFATLVRAGAANNGSLAAMRRVLSGPAVTNAGTPAATTPSAAATPTSGSAPAAAQSAPRSAVPAAAIPRAALRREEKGDVESGSRKRPRVAIAAIVLMAIALVIFWYASKRATTHTAITGEAVSPATSPQAAPADVPPAATPAGDAAATMGAPETTKSAPRAESKTGTRPSPATAPTESTPAGVERSVWHVVAYTYNYEGAAQRKAAELAAQYPQLEPQVFSPTGHAPYLVTLGGGMDRQQAFARRDAARTAGMPSDTYAMNFRK